MSREFRIQIEVSTHAVVNEHDFSLGLSGQGVRVSDVHRGDDELCASGEITLAGGEDCDEAHKRLAKAIGARLRTSWLYLEEHDWDVIIDDNEDEDDADFDEEAT